MIGRTPTVNSVLFPKTNLFGLVLAMLLCVACAMSTGIASGQVARSVIVDTIHVDQQIAKFAAAAAVGVDPFGSVYVLDQRRNTITRLSNDHQNVEVFGGPGIDGGRFDSPSDFDPTTGFLFLIADTGNGRIQRFGTDLVYLESLRMTDRGIEAGGRADGQYERQDVSEYSGFSPIAVTSSPDGLVFAIDSTSGNILEWNSNRQQVGVHHRARDNQLKLTDLFLDGNNLFATDDRLDQVVVFDLYGNELYAFGSETLRTPKKLEVRSNVVLVLDSNRILHFNRAGQLKRITMLEIAEDVVDFSTDGSVVYVLTKTALLAGH